MTPLSQVQLHSGFLCNPPEWCSGACNQSITVLLCFSFLLSPFFCSRVGSRGCIPVRSVLLRDGVCHGLQGVPALLWRTSSSDLGVPSSFLHLHFLPFLQICFPRGALCMAGGSACPAVGWFELAGTICVWHRQPQLLSPVATLQPCASTPSPRLAGDWGFHSSFVNSELWFLQKSLCKPNVKF